MNNFSFEPLKLKLATNNIIIPMENGVADLTNAETSAKIMLAGKELFPVFDESIVGRNLLPDTHFYGGVPTGWGTVYGTQIVENHIYKKTFTDLSGAARIEFSFDFNEIGTFTFSIYSRINSDINDLLWQNFVGLTVVGKTEPILKNDWKIYSVTFSATTAGRKTIRAYMPNTEIGSTVEIDYYTLVNGDNPMLDWQPAPEEVLQFATLTSYNCSAAIVGDLIKITSHKPGTTRGWVDTTVNYGNLSNTKRLNWSVEGVEPYKPLGTLLTMNNRGIKY